MDELNSKNFELISVAGMAKSDYLEAVMNASEGNREEADQLVREAEELSNQAHMILFELLQKQAQGIDIEMNIFAVHAQDHLTMATVAQDLCVHIISLYKQVDDLRKEIKELREEK